MGTTFFKSSASIKKPIVKFAPNAIQLARANGATENPTPTLLPVDLLGPKVDVIFPKNAIFTAGTYLSVDFFPTAPGQGFGAPYTAPTDLVSRDFVINWGRVAKGIDNMTQELVDDGTNWIGRFTPIALATEIKANNLVFTPA